MEKRSHLKKIKALCSLFFMQDNILNGLSMYSRLVRRAIYVRSSCPRGACWCTHALVLPARPSVYSCLVRISLTGTFSIY